MRTPRNAPDPSPSKLTKHHVDLSRIAERHRTARWGIVGAVFVAGLYFIRDVLIAYMNDPPLLKAFMATLAALTAGPSGLMIWLVIRSRKRYIDKHQGRVVRLEKIVDPNRSSSANLTARLAVPDSEGDK